MIRANQAAAAFLFVVTLPFKPTPAIGEEFVSYQLEMGDHRQKYECIFTGLVTQKGKPCTGARVWVDLAGAPQEEISDVIRSDDEGRFILRVTLEGIPDGETRWKLSARAPTLNAAPAQIEGRLILSQDPTVTIDRFIALDEQGA